MGCGCKSKNKSVGDEKIKTEITTKNYIVKFLLFTTLVIISPIFVGIIIWVLFRVLILDKELEVLPLLMKLVGKNDKIEEDKDDTEEDEDDEIIPINVEDVTNKYTK